MDLFSRCSAHGADDSPRGTGGRILHCAGHAVKGLVAVVAVALLFGWVVMTAWNAVIPAVAHLPVLDFWQAVALLVLARILVGHFHPGRRGHRWGRGAGFHRWWREEGEAAFRAYQARQTGEPAA